jgi:hypothetical protein
MNHQKIPPKDLIKRISTIHDPQFHRLHLDDLQQKKTTNIFFTTGALNNMYIY